FREAFGVPMLRISDATEDWGRNDLTYAWLSTAPLHWMAAFRGAPRPPWLGDLVVTDRDARWSREPVLPRELAAAWPTLDRAAQTCLTMILRKVEEYEELVPVLARLAERLQQKLIEADATQPEAAAG